MLQSLVAFHLGKGDRRSAAAVFRRTLSLAVFAGVVIMGCLLACQSSLPAVFTPDAAVVRQVSLVRRPLMRRGCGGSAQLTGDCTPQAAPLSTGQQRAAQRLLCSLPTPPQQVMPLIAVFMPLDAAASVMDGVLLGSQEAGWMSRTMAVTSFFCG
jgi:Na+-driven multidrug efflux pump